MASWTGPEDVEPATDYRQRLTDRESHLKTLDASLSRFGTARLAAGSDHPHRGLVRVRHALVLTEVAAAGSRRIRRIGHRSSRRAPGESARRAGGGVLSEGVARIEDRWQGTGQQGTQFDEPHHVYASDLDLFGKGGLFELLCTVRTRMGEERLAQWLKTPAPLKRDS